MRGLELSLKYFEEFGRPMLLEDFPDVLPFLCAGLCGSGSECLGFDDEVSRDHDFEPGFCIFLPDEDTVSRKRAFELERAYNRLPSEYEGAKRSLLKPAGGARRGVVRMSDFFMAKTGTPDGRLTFRQWLSLDEEYLLEAACGMIFFDNFGRMTAIRERLSYFPDDIRLKKLSSCLLAMDRAANYNYDRCIRHGEPEAAAFTVLDFAENAIHACFLLAREYEPYYKWRFKALKRISGAEDAAKSLSALVLSGQGRPGCEEETRELMQSVSDFTVSAAALQGLCGSDDDLSRAFRSVNGQISDGFLRNAEI